MSESLPRQLSSWQVVMRTIFLVFLTSYAAVLLVAALPRSKIEALQTVQTESREFLESFKIRAATEVFAGNRGAWKRKSLCLVALGTYADGTRGVLYENYHNCQVPNVRLFEDTFYVLLMRVAAPREIKSFLGVSIPQFKKAQKTLQTSASLDNVSRYFCKSPLALKDFKAHPHGYQAPTPFDGSTSRPIQVDILWEVKQVHYAKGKLRTDLVHAHSFDCQRNRRSTQIPERSRVIRTPSGTLDLVPRADRR